MTWKDKPYSSEIRLAAVDDGFRACASIAPKRAAERIVVQIRGSSKLPVADPGPEDGLREPDFAVRCSLSDYSWRRTATGSTNAARRAGTRPATSAMASNKTAAATSVHGSVAVIPYR